MERLKARSLKKLGLGIAVVGWSPCAHSIGKFFLWLMVFFLWNFRPRLARLYLYIILDCLCHILSAFIFRVYHNLLLDGSRIMAKFLCCYRQTFIQQCSCKRQDCTVFLDSTFDINLLTLILLTLLFIPFVACLCCLCRTETVKHHSFC